MTTTKKFKNIALSVLLLLLSFALSFVAFPQQKVLAEDEVAFSEVTITNSDFNSSTTTALQSSPTGWTRSGTSSGKNGVISVNSDNFSSRASSSYALQSSQNPYKAYSQLDDHVLMINAKSSTTTNETNHIGYVSNSISLTSYSYYRLSVWTLTQEHAVASIYLSGLNDEVANTSFERYSSTVWTEYRFYIATGIDSQSVKIELWLGSTTQDSMNAVFFDHITALKLSGSYYASETTTPNSRINIIDLRDYKDDMITNADFENGFEGWHTVNPLTYGDAKIISIQYTESMTNLGLEYLGSDLSENNRYSLLLYSNDNAASIGYESTSFVIQPFETYKITVWAKVSSDLKSKASIVLKEGNDVTAMYGEDEDFYSPVNQVLEITSNTSNSITNNYTPYYFYIKGHELYQTSFTLQLWLGTSTEGATGCVVFDNVKFEKISWNQFSSASSTNTKTVTLSTLSGTPSVTNGTFNVAKDLEKDFEYPVTPSGWTNESNDAAAKYGIINTYSPLYENYKDKIGNIQNPGNPSAVDVNNDVNNVVVLYNPQQAYQSITSETLSTTLDTYQKITFDYKTVAQSLNTNLLNVYVLDSDNNILFADENLYSENWTKYTLLIKSYGYSSTIKLKLSLGTSDSKVNGYLFVDNVKFENDSSMTDELYEAYIGAHKTLDFSVTNFNLISPTQQHDMYTAYRYTAELAKGTNQDQGNPVAYGGIIDGEDNIFGITNSETNNGLKYMPAFVSNGVATYYLTAKDALSLDSSNYYKFSVDVYTRFSGDFSPINENEEAKYGAVFAIKGLEKQFDNIVSNDEWTTYTLYAKVDSSTSVNLRFGITSNSDGILGQAFFDNFKFETIEETEYNQATNIAKSDATIIVSGEVVDDEEQQEDNTNNDSQNNAMIWYLIPTGLLFAALVIALIAYFGKNITIKKWEKKKVAEYDRDATVHRDVVRKDAEKIRDDKVKELKKQIAEIQEELTRIEELHKENVKANRPTTDKKVSREAERDFKAYAQRHTKLENQIELLNSKIDSLNMPEYLLSIQKSLILEKVKKEREEKDRVNKQKKQEQKQAKLANKNK